MRDRRDHGAAATWSLGVLEHRAFPLFTAALAVVLTLPALDYGLAWDDFMLHETYAGSPGLLRALLDTYVFVTPETVPALKDVGTLPWWVPDELRFAFLRPVSSLTFFVDHGLWPDSPALMHAQSIAWYAAVALTVGLLYRSLSGAAGACGLASLLFVLDDAHAIPVAWLALRNGLVALLFGSLALLFHVRWRRERSRGAAVAALAFFALALLSAELGVAVAGYVLAYALFLEEGSTRRRIAGVAPYAVGVVLWRGAYDAFGFGVSGSGVYADPLADPARFASAVFEGLPILLMGQFTWVSVDVYNALEISARATWRLTALACSLFLALVFWPLLRREPVARFWAAGMIFAALPVCISLLHSPRLWLFVGIGAMGLLAELVAGLVEGRAWVPSRLRALPLWAFALLSLGVHAVHAPSELVRSLREPVMQPELDRFLDVDTYREVGDRDVVVVNAPSPFHLYYLRPVFLKRGQTLPRSLRVLAPGYSDVEVRRVAPEAIEIRARGGYVLEPGSGEPITHPSYWFQSLATMYRDPGQPMRLGPRSGPGDWTIDVLESTASGNPTAVQFRLPEPLDSRDLVWLQYDWSHAEYVPFRLPALGETVRIPGGVR